MVSEEDDLMLQDADMQEDVRAAARSSVPVLISAPPDRAFTIAQTIVARSEASGSSGIRVCDAAAGDDIVAALSEHRLRAAMVEGKRTFLIPEVHMLSEVEQEAMMKLLETRPTRPPAEMPRLIVTSSVSLFDRVLQGTFDDRLFHRLNVIHIMVPSGTP
jgi:hypothetical protein